MMAGESRLYRMLYKDRWFLHGGHMVMGKAKYMIRRYNEQQREKNKKKKLAKSTEVNNAMQFLEEILTEVSPLTIKAWQHEHDDKALEKSSLAWKRCRLNDDHAKSFQEGDQVVIWTRIDPILSTIQKITVPDHPEHHVLHSKPARLQQAIVDYEGHPSGNVAFSFLEYENGNRGKRASVLIEHRVPGKTYTREQVDEKLSDAHVNQVVMMPVE